MEARFGHDFSRVRIHTDAAAADSARSLNAFAYTVGPDIVFARGRYAPATDAGRHLLAHELTHVVQQTSAGTLAVQRAETTEEAAPVDPAAAAPAASDAAIDALDLNATARAAAIELKKKHPTITFSSGRRDAGEQAQAMASNIVDAKNRKWIEQTYISASPLQKWVDDHPEATTVADLAKGLQETMEAMSDTDLAKVSKHLGGAAFDVLPQETDADTIKKDMKALTGLTKFLEKEGDLIRWHAQFKRPGGTVPGHERYEEEAERVADQVMRAAPVAPVAAPSALLAPAIQLVPGDPPAALTNPTLVLRVTDVAWYRGDARVQENAPGDYTVHVGCIPHDRSLDYELRGGVFVRSQDSGAEVPYTRAAHEQYFPGVPFLSDVWGRTDMSLTRMNITEVPTLADGSFTMRTFFIVNEPVRALEQRMEVRDPKSEHAAAAATVKFESVQGPKDLISVCELALEADVAAAEASAKAAAKGDVREPLWTGTQTAAVPFDTKERDRINYYLGAVGLALDAKGFLTEVPGWTSPDPWRWQVRNEVRNYVLNPHASTFAWTARFVYDWLERRRGDLLGSEGPPLPFAVFIGELRRFENENPSLTIEDEVRALRRAAHERDLPFDAVIGTPKGRFEEYATGGVGGPLQFFKDHNAVFVRGEKVDIFHLVAGLDAIPLDNRDVVLRVGAEDGVQVELELTGMEGVAAATWAGDLGSVVADWHVGADPKNERGVTRLEKLQYYWHARLNVQSSNPLDISSPSSDLDSDIDAWGVTEERKHLPPDLSRLSDLLLHMYGTPEVAAHRRDAYRAFAQYYSPTGWQDVDVDRLRTQVAEFARVWVLNRLKSGGQVRFSNTEYEWAIDQVTWWFISYVESRVSGP